MTPGEVYLAPPFYGGDVPLWRVSIVSKPRHGSVAVRWLEGPLKGREAQLQAKTLKPLERK